MPNIGPLELVIILVVIMMIFGVGKLPEVGGAIGKGVAEFRKGVSKREDPTRTAEAEKRVERAD